MTQNLSSCLRRLRAESTRIKKEGISIGFYALPTQENNLIYDIYIAGSKDSPYEGSILKAKMQFPNTYPITPPTMKFETEMFHPNIYTDGRVCISILHIQTDDPTAYESPDERWTPVHGICTIVLSVISILNDPNIASPANVDASNMLSKTPAKYTEVVRKLAQQKGTKWKDIKKEHINEEDLENLQKLFKTTEEI